MHQVPFIYTVYIHRSVAYCIRIILYSTPLKIKHAFIHKICTQKVATIGKACRDFEKVRQEDRSDVLVD
jgi:hypothetical protein